MFDFVYLASQICAGLVVFVTFWGWLPLDYWWVRGVDFPRIQILVVGAFSLLLLLMITPKWQMAQISLFLALLVAIGFQMRMVLPYTWLWPKQVKQASAMHNPTQLTLMVSNVLTPNNNTQALIDLVCEKQPDILITLESDMKWQQALSVIEADYAYRVKVPLDNLYGMHLYSKLELIDPQVKYLLVDDIPSIHTQIRLPNDKRVWLYCLHPMPPSPTEAEKSTTRDAELLLVGRHIKANQQVAILAGDLNDVAWSKTTRMFQRISGLLDPRVGRFFINTFHADYPFLRWALDHLFHSPCFTLVSIERLPSIGSDHFPVLTTLQYEPCACLEQIKNTTTASKNDQQDSNQKIIEGRQEAQRISQQENEQTDGKH